LIYTANTQRQILFCKDVADCPKSSNANEYQLMKSSQTGINFPNNSGRFLSAFQRKHLEKSLEKGLSKRHFQRIQIMLLADEGKTQTQICQELGWSHSTARHWITLAKSGQAHQWNSGPIGRPQTVDEECLQRLRKLVSQSPREVKVPHRDFSYSASRWTAKKLSEHLSAELGIKISDRHINRLLKQMGLSTRPKSNNLEKNEPKKSSKSGIVIRDIPEEVAFS
jgi:transposase